MAASFIDGPGKNAVKYPMKRRGNVFIFNEGNHENGIIKKDKENVRKVFRNFRMDVFDKTNRYNKEQLINELKKTSEDPVHKDADCLVVFILSDGETPGKLSIEEIIQPFHGPGFDSKPKLFFIQASSGNSVEKQITLISTRKQNDGAKPKGEIYSIPESADTFLARATTDGCKAFGDPVNGSWFIADLCAELEENGTIHEIERLLKTVKRRVALRTGENNSKQMPITFSTLIKDLHF